MRFFNRFKFIILIFNFILVFCGFLFIGNYFNKQPKAVKKEDIYIKSIGEKALIDELSNCKSDLFVVKNKLEQAKFIPDSRQDTIKLLLVMRNFEQNIGKKIDFSSDCVNFFSLASRIPIIQEYVLKYKEQMFKNNCNFVNNEGIIQMILPFQIKNINFDEQNEEKNNWYKRILYGIKIQASKLFIKSKIQKSDLEVAVENFNYDEALNILIKNDFKKNNEYNELYDAISALKNIKQMLNGIYDILKTDFSV